MFIYDLAIIGGGVSGLTLCISALQKGKDVLLFEKNDRPGKKLLMTGNGKCNISNINMDASKYNTTFVKDIISKDIRKFLFDLGLITKNLGDRVYPYSESANDVLNILRKQIPTDCIITSKEINKIDKENDYYVIDGKKFKNVALCTGSKATVGTNSYSLYEKFGHNVTTLTPSIVPLLTDKTYLKQLDGLRVKCRLTLCKDKKPVWSDAGELLFRQDGVSGIVSMMASTYIARHPGDYSLSIDFIPDLNEVKILNIDGVVRRPIAIQIENQAKDRKIPVELCLKDFILQDVKLGDITKAQVVCGGLDLTQFNENLESKLSKGLFACGEVLDVDGECGGYNVHFAMASALTVGDAI